MRNFSQGCAAVLIGLALALPTVATAEDKAPMPQTKGMAGMDPALHDQWAKEQGQDPYKDCTPNAQAKARQSKYPMPDTKGMKGMDPKAHEVDCPEAAVKADDKPRHVHKGPGG